MAFAAVLALLVGAVVAGGVAFYPHASDASRERAEEAILPGNQLVAESAAALEHAEKLDDLAEVGAAAGAAIAEVELVDTRGISDSRFRSAAEAVLQGQLALLSALEPLADLDESTVGKWRRSHRRGIRAAVRQIASAQPAVAELDLTDEMNVWGPVLNWSLANADAVVAKASRRLRRWRARVQAVRQERRAALAAVATYDSSVRRYLATYDGLGTDLDDWIRKVDTEGVTFAEAYKFLGHASTARQSVRNGIASLDTPAAVASAHTSLLTFMDRAIAAVDSASAGVSEYERDSKNGKYSYYTEAPGWQRFRSESDAAARESAAARSSWQAAVAAEVEQIQSIKPPKRPDV